MTAAKPWTLPAHDEPRVRLFLKQVCAAPPLLARFLNTLSLMEHIGSRKIMISQSRGELGLGTLQHLAEETRHAYFFKRAAEGVAQGKLAYDADAILAGPRARFYMGRLDAFVARSAQGQAAYLYMSLLIEIRAVWFYKILQDVFRQMRQPINLTSLLAEETMHLEEMGKHLRSLGEDLDTRLPVFAAYEEAQFTHLLAGLEHAICAGPALPDREAALL